jgi:hypothetical protein
MDKIATPSDLITQLSALQERVSSESVSRDVVASELRNLADKLSASKRPPFAEVWEKKLVEVREMARGAITANGEVVKDLIRYRDTALLDKVFGEESREVEGVLRSVRDSLGDAVRNLSDVLKAMK